MSDDQQQIDVPAGDEIGATAQANMDPDSDLPETVEEEVSAAADLHEEEIQIDEIVEPGQPRLVVKRDGQLTDEEFVIHCPATIGRFDAAVGPVDVDLGDIQESGYISRKHAKITCEDGKHTIHDLGSSNGTFILRDDFERVEEAEIVEGDEIALGNARFVFKIAAPMSDEAPAED